MDKIQAIAGVVETVEGVKLLDIDPGKTTNILPGEAKQKQNIVLYVECIGGIDPENPDPLAPGEEGMEPAPTEEPAAEG